MIEKLNSKNLLFIEDDRDFLDYGIEFFKLFFHNVFVTDNIANAQELLNSKEIDLIITDIHLKDENALAFIKKFRDSNQNLPIVILSGYKDENLLFEAMNLNLSGYLLKPIDYDSFVEVLKNVIKKMDLLSNDNIEFKSNIVYNTKTKSITLNGERIELNRKEILFFDMLTNNQENIITREMFQEFVWQEESMSDNGLNNFISRIRKKFGKDLLLTINNIGYKLSH